MWENIWKCRTPFIHQNLAKYVVSIPLLGPLYYFESTGGAGHPYSKLTSAPHPGQTRQLSRRFMVSYSQSQLAANETVTVYQLRQTEISKYVYSWR